MTQLFEAVGAWKCANRRFALLIEGLLSGEVNPDEQRQRALVESVRGALASDGLQVVETGSSDGYPTFAIVRDGAHHRPPQLILFASRNGKPDLRLADLLDQQLEVLTESRDVLAYDLPVPEKGLLWEHIEDWWNAKGSTPAGGAKKSLWTRLLTSLPETSPPQRELFEQYHRIYGPGGPFIAMLPEAWLHWDPRTRAARGEQAFKVQRMDFLMFLPGHRRIVLEVDGDQHYSDNSNCPSPQTYAETVQGDRDLRLSGYEVYRFGGYELTQGRAETTTRKFFDRLLGGAT